MELTISFGNILTILVLVIGFISQHYNLSSKLAVLEEFVRLKVENLEKDISNLDNKTKTLCSKVSKIERNCIKSGHLFNKEQV